MNDIKQCKHVNLDGSNCNREYRSKGYCISHYEQLRHGHNSTFDINGEYSKERKRMNGLSTRFKYKNAKWTNDGYNVITIPTCSIKRQRIKEHRFIMGKYLNRELLPQEHVHHINGIRNDNCIENLFLFNTKGEHTKYHHALLRTTKLFMLLMIANGVTL